MCCTCSALQPSGTYFAAKVSGRHNPANAGIPLWRENLPLRCRAYFPVRALSGCFLPPFRCRKINPDGRTEGEQRERNKLMLNIKIERL